MPIDKGRKLAIDQSRDASARILLSPFPPQNASAQVKGSPIGDYTAGIDRQPLALHRDRHMQPLRKHSKPRSEPVIRNVDASDEGRRMRASAALANRGSGAEISITEGKQRFDLALPRRVHAVFDQDPAGVCARRRKHKAAHASKAIKCHHRHPLSLPASERNARRGKETLISIKYLSVRAASGSTRFPRAVAGSLGFSIASQAAPPKSQRRCAGRKRGRVQFAAAPPHSTGCASSDGPPAGARVGATDRLGRFLPQSSPFNASNRGQERRRLRRKMSNHGNSEPEP